MDRSAQKQELLRLDAFRLRWKGVFDHPSWTKRTMVSDGWTFGGMIEFMKRHDVRGEVVTRKDASPYFYFLGELLDAMLETEPHTSPGKQWAEVCTDLANFQTHDLQSLFATVVLENVLRDSSAWRAYFFES